MSLTWELARVLEDYHGLDPSRMLLYISRFSCVHQVAEVPQVTKEMRTHGVRKENAFQNIGLPSAIMLSAFTNLRHS